MVTRKARRKREKVYLSTGRVPPMRCPGCGSINDGMTTSSSKPGETVLPADGAPGVCANCAEVLIYDASGPRFRLATIQEVEALDPRTRQMLEAMRDLHRERAKRG